LCPQISRQQQRAFQHVEKAVLGERPLLFRFQNVLQTLLDASRPALRHASRESCCRLETIQPRQHDVEHDQCIAAGQRHLEPLLTVRRTVRVIAMINKQTDQPLPNRSFIFDDQQLEFVRHGAPMESRLEQAGA